MENCFKLMKSCFIYVVCISLALDGFGQTRKVIISARISSQLDFQKSSFKNSQFPFEYKEQTSQKINWGLDVLAERKLSKSWYLNGGLGYYKNTFNFKRAYDHRLLNAGTDSIPIGTSTNNYTFHLLRFPIGIGYQVYKNNRYLFNVGLEHIVNFSFAQNYNGSKAAPDASTTRHKFEYYGNSVVLIGRITKASTKSRQIHLEPYIRVLNFYNDKNDVLFEYGSKPVTRYIDAFGLSIKFSTHFGTPSEAVEI